MVAFPHSPATTLGEVLADLRAAAEGLEAGDGLRYFNRLYTDVTTSVVALVRSGHLERPGFVERLAVRFSNAYFAALQAGVPGPQAVAAAWRPLFEARDDRRVAPIQFVLAALNAHVNYDLAVGLVATCEELGVELRAGSPEQRDFGRINRVIEAEQERAKRWLYSGLVRELDRLLGRVDDVVANWSVARARDAAWTQAVALWHIRGEPELADAFRDTLAHNVGFAGRGLLVPTIWGLQRWTDRLVRIPR